MTDFSKAATDPKMRAELMKQIDTAPYILPLGETDVRAYLIRITELEAEVTKLNQMLGCIVAHHEEAKLLEKNP